MTTRHWKRRRYLVAVVLITCVIGHQAQTFADEAGRAERWYEKGMESMKYGRMHGALEAFGHAVDQRPDDAGAWAGKADARSKLGHYEKAVEAYERAVKLDPDIFCRKKDGYSRAVFYRGRELSRMLRHAEALEKFKKAVDLDPEYAGAWLEKGRIFEQLGHEQEAHEAYERAVEHDPGMNDLLKQHERRREELKSKRVQRAKDHLRLADTGKVPRTLMAWIEERLEIREISAPEPDYPAPVSLPGTDLHHIREVEEFPEDDMPPEEEFPEDDWPPEEDPWGRRP